MSHSSTSAPLSAEKILVTDRLFERVSHSSDSQEENAALHSLLKYLADEPHQGLGHLVATAMNLCKAGSAGVSLLDRDQKDQERIQWIKVAGELASYESKILPRHDSSCGTTLIKGEPSLFSHPESVFLYLQEIEIPICEELIVPIFVEEKAIGTLWVTSHEETRQFHAEDLRILKNLANLASTILRTDISDKKLQKTSERLDILSRAAGHLLTTEDPEKVVRGLFDNVSEHFELGAYFNFMVNDEGDALRLDSCAGIPEEIAKTIDRLEFGEAVCGTVALEKHPIFAADIQHSDDPKTELVKSFGLQAYACHPLMVGDRLLGTLSFATRTRPEFTEEEIEFFRTVCYYVAMTKERLRLLAETKDRAERLEESLDREREIRLQAETANRLKDEFLATMSHELRTPLNAMLGWIQLLRSGKIEPQTTLKAYETIERNIKAQARLVEDLLDVSRIISGKLRLDMQKINICHPLKAAIDAVSPAAEAKGITIETSFRPEAESVFGDGQRLQQVAWNLVSNAVKFTPNGGHVKVVLQQVHSHIELTVSDTGQGIAEGFLPYVFERFRQADSSSKRQHGGLGLGLAIVRHLVELHGGTVSAESKGEGKGAVFVVRLPLHAAISEPDQAPLETESIAKLLPSSGSLEGVKILVVDDDFDSRSVIQVTLEVGGAEVRSAASVREALAIFQSWNPTLLVSDIGMPGEDGYDLIKTLRANGIKTPAVALTAYAKTEDKVRILTSGFQLHVPKPVETNELLAAAASLCITAG